MMEAAALLSVTSRLAGMSLTNVAKKYGVSRASVVRFVREAQRHESSDLNDRVPMLAQNSSAIEYTA